jgi:hypothetical protein
LTVHGDDADVVRVRGKTYRRDVLPSTHEWPRPVDARSRWRRTEVSFGPVGRCLSTIVVFVPLWRFIATGSIFWMLTTFAAVPVTWLWLRETWRRT